MKERIFNDKTKRIIGNILYPLISFAIVVAVWAIVAKVKNKPLVLPMPDVVIKRFFTLGGEAGFWKAVGFSLLRTLLCFAASFLIAFVFSAISKVLNPVYRVINPVVSFLRAAPTVAVILILYAFYSNETLAFVVGFLIAFPILFTAIYSALSGVDKDLIEMTKIYKVKKIDVVKNVYLPEVAPNLFDNARSTLSLTFKVIIAAEILTFVPKSIGSKIYTANASFDVAYLLAWTLVAIVFAFVLEAVVSIFKKIWEKTR